MKYRGSAIALALALMLSGCGIVSNRYVNTKAHTDSYAQPEKAEAQTVATRQELENAMLTLIHSGVKEAELNATNYSGDFVADFAEVQEDILSTDPESAYMVESISKRITAVDPYYKLNLLFCYRRAPMDAENAQTVSESGKRVEDIVAEAMERCEEKLLLRFDDYHTTDFNAIAEEYFENNLLCVMAKPSITARSYPATGSARLMELSFTYSGLAGKPTLEGMRSSVDTIMDSAEGYVKGTMTEMEKAMLLYSFLAERFDYKVEPSTTPAYDMLFSGIADSHTFSAVYYAMCERAGLECTEVSGTKDAEPYNWVILELGAGTWHVDPLSDEQAGRRSLQFLTDSQMVGYEWEGDYPVCFGYVELPPVQEVAVTEATENTPEIPEEGPNSPELPADPPVGKENEGQEQITS